MLLKTCCCSDILQPHGLQHTWLPVPYYLPAAAAAKLLQSCPPLCDPMDSSPPGSSVHGILQARILEWVAISLSIISQSFLKSCLLSQWLYTTISSSVTPPSPFTFSLSQHQGCFQWVCSSHQVAKVLELQYQSFQ